MNITVKVRFEGLNDIKDTAFTIEEGFIPKAALEKIGEEIIGRIRERTRDGVDASGATFEPYSKTHKEKRKKEGKSETPNLEYTGAMIKALRVSANEETQMITLYIAGRAENERAHFNSVVGAGKGKVVREFFTLSRDDEDYIKRALGNTKITITKNRFGKLA